jgi:four helix bundle protein
MGKDVENWAKTFFDLFIWKKSMDFVTEIYKATADFPQSEKFGLVAQLRRAAVSIPSNIAEGFGRKSKQDFARFCQIAVGSLFEVQTQVIVAKNINYLSEKKCQEIFDRSREIERMISSFILSLRKGK